MQPTPLEGSVMSSTWAVFGKTAIILPAIPVGAITARSIVRPELLPLSMKTAFDPSPGLLAITSAATVGKGRRLLKSSRPRKRLVSAACSESC